MGSSVTREFVFSDVTGRISVGMPTGVSGVFGFIRKKRILNEV